MILERSARWVLQLLRWEIVSYAFDAKYADLKQKMCMGGGNNKAKFQKYFVIFFGRLMFIKMAVFELQTRFLMIS